MYKNSKTREIIRTFFSFFLIGTCFVGCGSIFYWMGDMAKIEPEYKSYEQRQFVDHRYNYVEPDTVDLTRKGSVYDEEYY